MPVTIQNKTTCISVESTQVLASITSIDVRVCRWNELTYSEQDYIRTHLTTQPRENSLFLAAIYKNKKNPIIALAYHYLVPIGWVAKFTDKDGDGFMKNAHHCFVHPIYRKMGVALECFMAIYPIKRYKFTRPKVNVYDYCNPKFFRSLKELMKSRCRIQTNMHTYNYEL